MEESRKEDIQEELKDILSIIQILEVNLAETGEEWIMRSIRIISKLIKAVIEKYLD